jgi:hypothetical protein
MTLKFHTVATSVTVVLKTIFHIECVHMLMIYIQIYIATFTSSCHQNESQIQIFLTTKL